MSPCEPNTRSQITSVLVDRFPFGPGRVASRGVIESYAHRFDVSCGFCLGSTGHLWGVPLLSRKPFRNTKHTDPNPSAPLLLPVGDGQRPLRFGCVSPSTSPPPRPQRQPGAAMGSLCTNWHFADPFRTSFSCGSGMCFPTFTWRVAPVRRRTAVAAVRLTCFLWACCPFFCLSWAKGQSLPLRPFP